jgi:hypothetical protein
MTNPYTDHAEAYRRAGWAGVLRLPHGKKFPPPEGMTGEGGAWPTNAKVDEWITQGGNIALRLPRNVVALDVDSGAEAFAQLAVELGPLPATWRSVGNPGRLGHFYFRLPEGVDQSGLKAPCAGVDLLRHGHRYSVVWPSVHPDFDDVTYRWVNPNGHLLDEGDAVPRPHEIPTLPDAWVERLKGGAPVSQDTPPLPSTWDEFDSGRAEIDEPIHGNHDDALAAYTASLVARGIDKAEALILALKRAEACVGGDPSRPFTERDFERWWRGAEAKFTPVDLAPFLPAVTHSAGNADDTTAAEISPYDREVAKEAMRLKVAQEARRRLIEAEAPEWPVYYGTLRRELELPEEEQTWAVRDLLPMGGNAVLTAQFKAGKTTTMLNLVRAYADGEPFLGAFDVEPAVVGVFNYEVGAAQWRRWARDIAPANTDNVHPWHLRGHPLSLTSEYVKDGIVDWLVAKGIQAWIVDPLGPAMPGVDENSNTEVRAVLSALDEIKARAGVRDLIVTVHTGRGQESQGRARGATVVDDWPDARWILIKDNDLGGARFFSASGRDVELEETQLLFDSNSKLLSLGLGDRASLKAKMKQDEFEMMSAEAVAAIVAEAGEITAGKLQAAIGGRKEGQLLAIKRATDMGLITWREVGKAHLYTLRAA